MSGPIPVAPGRPRSSAGLNVCGIRLGPPPPCVLPGLGSRPARARSAAALAAGLALAATVAADAATARGPAVGASATYRWTSTLTQTVPVLVQQPGAGGQVAWSVAQESVAPGPIAVTYAVIRGNAKSYTLQIVTRARPDGPPLSVTQVTVGRGSGKAVRSVVQGAKGPVATPESGLRPIREADVAQGRREEVAVPAGRFTVIHGAAQGAELWVSDQVPVLGLVKGVWREGTLELVASSPSGAQDLLKKGAK